MLRTYFENATRVITRQPTAADLRSLLGRHVVFLGRKEEDLRPLLAELLQEEIARGHPLLLFDPSWRLTESVMADWAKARHRPLLLEPDVIYTHTLNPLQLSTAYGPRQAADAATSAIGAAGSLGFDQPFLSLIWAGCYLLAAARQGFTLLELSRWFYQRRFRNAVAEAARDSFPPQDSAASARAFGLWEWISAVDRGWWADHLSRAAHILTTHLYGQPYPCLLFGASKGTIAPGDLSHRSIMISHSGFTCQIVAAWIKVHMARASWRLPCRRRSLYVYGSSLLGVGPLADLAMWSHPLRMRLRLGLTAHDPWLSRPLSQVLATSDLVIPTPDEQEDAFFLGAIAAAGTQQRGFRHHKMEPANRLVADLARLRSGQYLVSRQGSPTPQVGRTPALDNEADSVERELARDWILEPEARPMRSVAEEILRRNCRLDAEFGKMGMGLMDEWYAPFAKHHLP